MKLVNGFVGGLSDDGSQVGMGEVGVDFVDCGGHGGGGCGRGSAGVGTSSND